MSSLLSIEFTSVAISGLNGAGTLDLSSGVLLGPFAPAEGDKIVSIREGTDEYLFDDATGFASEVGANATLRQFDASNLSGATLIVVIARLGSTVEPDQTPILPVNYKAIWTTIGLQRLAEAQAAYEPLVFTHVAVGDGGGAPITPSSSMTELVNETARVATNSVEISPDAPTTVRVEGHLPSATGGFMIREAGIFNGDGELLAVASYPPTYKAVPGEGVTQDTYIRVLLVYAAVEAIALTTDPDVIMATRHYVDDRVGLGQFGDGSDGDFVADGVNEHAAFSRSGNIYTLTRSAYFKNLTLDSPSIEIKGNGFPLYVKDHFDDSAGGFLTRNGASGGNASGTGTIGTAGSGGGGSSDNLLGTGGQGGDGTYDGVSGSAGTSKTKSLGGAGGDGGTSNLGGKAGGSVTALTAAEGDPRNHGSAMPGHTVGAGAVNRITGGAGGGGGEGIDSTGSGGGGGAGAGVLFLAAKKITLAGANNIQAVGGNGGNGMGVAGGGGGGGGGGIHIVCGEISHTLTSAVCCPGGAGGNGAGGGDPGDDGNDGRVVVDLVVWP